MGYSHTKSDYFKDFSINYLGSWQVEYFLENSLFKMIFY